MSKLVNASITINPKRLNFPLAPLQPRRLHSYTVEFVGIPENVTDVIMRVFKPASGGYFDIPVSTSPSGSYAYIVGTCFPAEGAAYYEVHAYDENGNPTSLGSGAIVVGAFSDSASPLVPGQPVPIMQIADATGALHTIQAVPDGMGGFTTIVDADFGGREE